MNRINNLFKKVLWYFARLIAYLIIYPDKTNSEIQLSDSQKINVIIKTIDLLYPNDQNPEIQNDLQRISYQIKSLEETGFWHTLTLQYKLK